MEQLKLIEKGISDKIKKYNVEFQKQYFIYNDNNSNNNSNNNFDYIFSSFDDDELYKFNRNISESIRTNIIYSKLNKKIDNLEKMDFINLLKYTTFGCKHLFHDDKWIKFNFDEDNFICKIKDEDENNHKKIYCNSINKSDLKDKTFINFVMKMESLNFDLKFINFDRNNDENDENDENYENDDYNNDNVCWVAIFA